MPGCIKTKDCIENKFKVFGRLSVVYLEVRLEVGSYDEHLDAVAQLIAEAYGMYLRLQ